MHLATDLDASLTDGGQIFATESTKNRLLSATLLLWSDSPGSEVSVRSIVARARASPSSIGYHFGDLEQLYEAAQRQALVMAEKWMKGCLEEVSLLHGHVVCAATRASVIANLVDEWCEKQRPLAMARIEAADAARHGAMEIHRAWLALWKQFWSDCAEALDMAEHAPVLTAFVDGEAVQHLLRWRRVLDRALLDETVLALIRYLDGASQIPAEVRPAYQAQARAEQRTDSSDASLDAGSHLDLCAADILAESGLSCLTFRAVATRANSTLGQTSYYFGSKSRMVRQAFEQLYSQRFTDNDADSPLLAAGNVTDAVVAGITQADSSILSAFDEIILVISRSREFDDMRGLIRSFPDPAAVHILRSISGNSDVVSTALAAALSSVCRGVDRMTLAGSTREERLAGAAVLEAFLGR